MSTWGFSHEKNDVAVGANTVAGLVAGQQPFYNADVLSSKRNVIATNIGWVRRTIKTTDGNVRIIDEPVVAAHPGPGGFSYASNTYLAFPDISQIYSSAASYTANASLTGQIFVVFNEPIKHSGAAGNLKLSLQSLVDTVTLVLDGNVSANVGEFASNANTLANSEVLIIASSASSVVVEAGGGSYPQGSVVNFLFANGQSTGVSANVVSTSAQVTAFSSAISVVATASNSNTGIVNANNTLVFNFPLTPAGTYKVGAQTVTNATSVAANLRSWNTGEESANLVITGAVSNTFTVFTIV